MPLPAEAAQAIGQTLESLMQGLYISVFYSCSVALLTEGRRRCYVMFAISMSLFIVNTAHYIAGVYQNVEDVKTHRVWTYTAAIHFRDYVFIASIWIASIFMVYRCFVVWNKWIRIILFPSILCLANIGVGVWLVVLRSQDDTFLISNLAIPQIFYITSAIAQLVSSGLVIYRILELQHEMKKVAGRDVGFIPFLTTLIVESGLLHFLLLLALVSTSYLSRTGMKIISGCIVPSVGLVISSIFLRIGRGISYGDPIRFVPVGFRDTTPGHIRKETLLPMLLPPLNFDDKAEFSRGDDFRFDLTN